MQKVCEKYAKTMQKVCKNNAKRMQKVFIGQKKYN